MEYNVTCAKCGAEGGSFATIPGLGPVVYCTSCRRELAPEGWLSRWNDRDTDTSEWER